MRQRIEALAARPRNPDLVRTYATAIVRAELEGSRPRADALRSLYFAEWQAPVGSGDARLDVTRARANLKLWAGDPQRPEGERALWQALAKAIDESGAAEPESAVQLLRRLPIYCEQLFAEPTTAGASK
jgi:hypothetical protein